MDNYNQFYTKNRSPVFAYLVRLIGDYQLADDLVQESFTRYLARYGGRTANRALLYTIARNAALDVIRKQREVPLPEDSPAPLDDNPEHRVIEKERIDRMISAIQQLNAMDRELIALLSTEAFSYKEIGKILNISTANVKVKVHRARLRLKAILDQGGPE